jgi:PPOX class probable F420-dependent enzyme
VKLLESARIAHLATVSADGKPHIVPVVYAYDGKHIYIVLDDKPKRTPPMRLKRVRNIQANPSVSLLVDHYDEDWSKLAWVRVDGTARILHRGKAHDAAIKLLRAKYHQYRKMKIEERPVIEITVKRIVDWKANTAPSGRQDPKGLYLN